MGEIEVIEIIVAPGQRKERIDKFLTHQLENHSRTKAQELLDEGMVLVNDVVIKKNYSVAPNDRILVTIPVRHPAQTELAEDIPINIVYEDDCIIIVNKEAGMVTHPAYSNYTGTLVNALLYYTTNLSTTEHEDRPGIVHRIDRGTSGLLVVAKTDAAHKFLSDQFMAHSIEREYRTIVWGVVAGKSKKLKTGTIETYLERSKSDRKKFAVSDTGKRAVTHYEVLEEFDFFTYMKLNLETGRTHQIRVHLSHMNHPVLGDPTYGGRKLVYGNPTPKFKAFVNNILNLTPYQLLHAKTLGFIHPKTKKKVRFDSELPPIFQSVLSRIQNLQASKKKVYRPGEDSQLL